MITPSCFNQAMSTNKLQRQVSTCRRTPSAIEYRNLAGLRSLCLSFSVGSYPLGLLFPSTEARLGRLHIDYTLPGRQSPRHAVETRMCVGICSMSNLLSKLWISAWPLLGGGPRVLTNSFTARRTALPFCRQVGRLLASLLTSMFTSSDSR